jgi:hypothetical protein
MSKEGSSPKHPVIGHLTAVVLALIAFALVGSAEANEALWVANGTSVAEFVPAQLTNGVHHGKPRLVLSSSVFVAVQDVMFDTSGNLWVVDEGNVSAGGTAPGALDVFTPSQLLTIKKNPSQAPSARLTSTSFMAPREAVLDASGNLWVTDSAANAVYVFASSQLGANTAVTPSVTITSNPPFSGPIGIAVSGGNLWIANNINNSIYGFDSSVLPALGTGASVVAPNVVLTANTNGSLSGPWALAFDSGGNLWVSNSLSVNTIVEIGGGDLGASGAVTPSVTITAANVHKVNVESLSAPTGLAFDDSGRLAVGNAASPFGIDEFKASSLGSAQSRPDTFIEGPKTTLLSTAGVSFGLIVEK